MKQEKEIESKKFVQINFFIITHSIINIKKLVR